MRKNKLSYLAIAFTLFIVSCAKDPVPAPVTTAVTTGVYTLNQGLYGANNTSLTYYSFGTSLAITDYFKNVNGFGLGDTGSDFIIYGGKTYIVVNNSGYVAVINSFTAKFIDTIGFKNAGVNRGPENVVAAGNKVFVSSTDGTVAVIDTSSLVIQTFITVGSNPAQMAVSGDHLLVSNTGAFSSSYDSTVSVISLSTLTETRKIIVGTNPGSIAVDNSGNMFVACTGDYGTITPTIVKVSLTSNQVIKTASMAAGSIRYFNGFLLTTGGYLGSANVAILDPNDFSPARASFITDGSTVVNPYGLDVDPATADVYVGDAKDYTSSGEVFCFDKTGKKKFSFSVSPGISPIRTGFIVQ
jgi:YVTN family beta-propeller protein